MAMALDLEGIPGHTSSTSHLGFFDTLTYEIKREPDFNESQILVYDAKMRI